MAWWQTCFDEDYPRIHSPALTPEPSDQETERVIALLGLRPHAILLDLCCGQGRHSLRLAHRGYRVFGLAYSSRLLAEARRAASGIEVTARLVRGDTRDMPYREQFDALTNLTTAIGYFAGESDNQRVLDGVCRALKRSGKFLIEIAHCDWLVRVFQARDWAEIDGLRVWEERWFDPVARPNTSTRSWRTDGGVYSQSHVVRVYSATELTGMIREAGLLPLAYYGGLDGSDFHYDSRWLVIVA